MKKIFKYILIGIIWCLGYTIINLIKMKENFITFMQSKNYIYELILYFIISIMVTFIVEIRSKKKIPK
ncbi:hypothetical protein SAMN02745196_02221 [Clostridium collagenovorans DSM 3089]|uniref:Uncharacterized protein n=1 Tax=Clostridium collagenovorans DSM 3089 TaxID=1121306 RepID=A0A1M5XG18_9CLOT|nr:hypothetical protein [Clostridium collagenovorans]SHH98770.1 hypothetical protein SAMN02745196_02221 [Clostridium collagenovorans DSM 3089]